MKRSRCRTNEEVEMTERGDSPAAGNPLSKRKVSLDYFILPLLDLTLLMCEQKRASSDTLEIYKGPFAIFDHRANATNLQRFIVPWLIASYGLSYPKTQQVFLLSCSVVHQLPADAILYLPQRGPCLLIVSRFRMLSLRSFRFPSLKMTL